MKTPAIFDLPTELCDEIFSQLGYQDLLSFRLACRTASALVPLERVRAKRRILKTALLADEHADYANRAKKYENFSLWARAFPHEHRSYISADTVSNIHANYITRATRLNCYACLQTLPRECFTDGQIMGNRSLGHKDAARRFCKACGVKKGIWAKGATVKGGGRTYIVCKGCESMVKADARFKKDGVCSADCLGRLVERLSLQATATDGSAEDASLIGRSTRCLRCWATSHTERLADGEKGLHLCMACEAEV